MKHTEQEARIRRPGRWLRLCLSCLFTLLVIAATVMVIYALRLGVDTPDVSVGYAQETAPPQESTQESTLPPASSEEEEEEPSTSADPALEAAQQRLLEMSLEEKVYQLFITSPDALTGVYGLEWPDETLADLLSNMPVGGMILYEANVYTADQVTALLDGMQQAAKLPMLLGIAAEGGYDNGLHQFGIAEEYEFFSSYGETGDRAAVRAMGVELGRDMKTVGFNLNFAPVADVLVEDNIELLYRSAGSDPAVAAELVSAMTEGLHESGMLACMKHFPGLASSTANTSYGAASADRTLDALRQTELVPFRAGIEAGVDMVLVSHLSLPEITGDDTPASLAPAIVTELLRQELGFEGVVVTDSMKKSAITYFYRSSEAAIAALQAGCDMILEPVDLVGAVDAVLLAIEDGELTEARIDESVLRILRMKYASGILSNET